MRIVLFVLLAAVCALVAVLLLRALRLRPAKSATHAPFAPVFDEEGAVRRFCETIRPATVWPRYGEVDRAPFDAFLPLLQKLYPRMFDVLETQIVNEYGLLLRWKGEDSDRPVVLMSHYDVVSADADKWKYPPFCGEVHDGSVWGRGTVDTKCILAALLEAGETLLGEGFTPRHDVWFSFTNNEETGGDTTPAIVARLRELGVTPWFVLDEGGAVVESPALGVRQEFAMVGVSEKGVVDAILKVSGVPGHSSTPRESDSTYRLVDVLDRARKAPFPTQLSPVTRRMLAQIAAYASFGYRLIFANLWLFAPLVKKLMAKNGETAAMLRTTVALTKLRGSSEINSIPNTAEVGMSVRVAPWDSTESALERLREAAGEHADVTYDYKFEPSPFSPTDSAPFRLLADTVEAVYPGVPTVPYVMNGGTDSKHFAAVFENVYRFAGFRFTAEERAGMHGNDEHLSVRSYLDGVRFYCKLLENLNKGE
jgi:carboxypeptidase PM20D1